MTITNNIMKVYRGSSDSALERLIVTNFELPSIRVRPHFTLLVLTNPNISIRKYSMKYGNYWRVKQDITYTDFLPEWRLLCN